MIIRYFSTARNENARISREKRFPYADENLFDGITIPVSSMNIGLHKR